MCVPIARGFVLFDPLQIEAILVVVAESYPIVISFDIKPGESYGYVAISECNHTVV